MSFKSYAATPQIDGSLLLTDPQPLLFSGKNGLIARFIRKGGAGHDDTWKLCPGALHALAIPPLQEGSRIIVFEQTEGDALELLGLQSVSGLSGRTTEMMFSFNPLVVLGGEAGLRVLPSRDGKTYHEDLSLDGGRDQPEGPWRWRKPHLAIGSVVVGSAPPAERAAAAAQLRGWR